MFHGHWFGRICIGGGFANFELDQVRRVVAGVARGAEFCFGVVHGLFETAEREIAERIGAQIFADLLRRVGRGDEFFLSGRVDAVVAGRDRWRAADAHVNFFGAGFAHHADELAAGGAADDGIVNEDNALSGDEFADGIEFQLYAEIADGLRRFDESAADVVIAYEAHAEWNAGFEREADGGGDAGVWDGDDHIGFDGVFLGEEASEHFAAVGDRAGGDDAIWAREIDVLENAVLVRLRRGGANGFDARAGDADHFAGFDFADIGGVEKIEGACFGGDDPGVGAIGRRKFAEDERAEAAGIADCVEFVLGEDKERVGTFDLIESVAERAGEIASLRASDEVNDDFGVTVGLKDGTAMLELAAPVGGVGEIAVVSDGDFAFVAIDHDGLGVEDGFIAGGGVAGVAGGAV